MSSQLAKHQPLLLRRRADLLKSRYECQGEPVTVVKDPVALQYVKLEGADNSLLELLDGRRSLSDVCVELQHQFPESTVEEHSVHAGIQRLHQQGLLVSSASAQGETYHKRGNKQFRQTISQFFSSILAMRFPGVNPTRFLDWCSPFAKVMFHPASLTIAIAYMLFAAMLLLVRIEQFYLEMPRIASFFSFENLPFFVATIFITKTVHELGHAIVCHYLGAQAHAIGFMLLVLSPAAYCDASDSWMLKNKRDRILIALAGMFFEILLAATAVFIWLGTEPGWLHLFCVNLILVSSVSTIVFNANPLLRYDGYYILSDYLEIPNMSKKANEVMLSFSRQLFLGMPPVRGLKIPERHRKTFYAYTFASFFYRWFIMAVIYWFLITFFESLNIAVVGYVLAAISLTKTLSDPLTKLYKFLTRPGATKDIKMSRVVPRIVVLLAVVGAILFVPLPRTEHAYFVIRPVDYRTTYVESEGVLKRVVVELGDQVAEGDLIAELENRDLQMTVTDLESRIAQLQSEIEIYESYPKGTAVAQPLDFQDKIAERNKVRSQLQQRQQQLDGLKIKALCDGIVSPPVTFGSIDVQTQTTTADHFDSRSLGMTLGENTPVCSVVASQNFEAVAFVDQKSMKQLAAGQPTELLLDEYLTTSLQGTLSSIKTENTQHLPDGLFRQAGGYIEAGFNSDVPAPRVPHFQLLISIDNDQPNLEFKSGMRGQAKISVPPASLFERIREFISRASSFR